MKTIALMLAVPVAALAATATYAQAPSSPQYQEVVYQDSAAVPQQQDLDRVLAPIALYPDPLLQQVLTAATHPRDVAEAARWSRDNGSVQGEEAVRAVEGQAWDPSVKSLVAFPEVLAAMGDQPDWTQRLGDAYATQQGAVMDTVQQLRQRADAAGNLQSSDQMTVQQQGGQYILEPAQPDAMYVPYYDPRMVYGSWWWPYAPVYWNPWPGYVFYGGIAFGWGYPHYVHHAYFHGGPNWGNHGWHSAGNHPYTAPHFNGYKTTQAGYRGGAQSAYRGPSQPNYRTVSQPAMYGAASRPAYASASQAAYRPQQQVYRPVGQQAYRAPQQGYVRTARVNGYGAPLPARAMNASYAARGAWSGQGSQWRGGGQVSQRSGGGSSHHSR